MPLSIGALFGAILILLQTCGLVRSVPPVVDISIMSGGQTTSFAIPKKYLKDPANRKGGEQTVISLKLVLPDIPAELADRQIATLRSELEQSAAPTFQQKTGITIMPGRPNVRRLFREDVKQVAQNTGVEVYGLIKYADNPRLRSTPNGFYLRDNLSYYFPKEEGAEHGLGFDCYSKDFVGRCRGWGDYSETLYYSYYFAEENLKHWKLLDANVRALLTQFERNAQLTKEFSGGVSTRPPVFDQHLSRFEKDCFRVPCTKDVAHG